jgi:RNA-dependent RNA polymerase
MIYDKVCGENLDFVPDQGSDFDDRIIGKYDISCDMLKAARDLKSQYDMCVRRILSQHALDTDFELWSGFALSKPAVGSDYKRQEQLGKEYDTVKQRFRELCYEVAGGHVPAKIDPFVAAMYQVTKEDVEAGTGSKQGVTEVELDEGADSPKQLATTVPLISFPWIFHWVLIRIALGDKYKPSKIQLGATGRKLEASITASDPSSGSPKPTGTTASSALQVQEKLLNVPLVTVEEINVGETPEELLEEDVSENEVMVINDDQVQSSIDMLAQIGLE